MRKQELVVSIVHPDHIERFPMAVTSKAEQRLAACQERGSSSARVLDAHEYLANARMAATAIEWPTTAGCNAEDWSLEDLQHWCAQWSSLFGNGTAALWMQDRCGISIAFSEAIRNLDELWFPSADDLCIISVDGLALLIVDHEEQVSLHQPKLRAGS